MSSAAALADAVFESVRGFVSRSLVDFGERLSALELRAPEKGEKGDPGESIDPAVVERLVEERVAAGLDRLQIPEPSDPEAFRSVAQDEAAKAVAALPPAPDPFDPVSVERLIDERVTAAFDQQLKPEPVDPEMFRSIAQEEAGKAISSLPAMPEPLDPASLEPLIGELVDIAAAKIRVPEDGKSVDPAEVAEMVVAEVQKAVAAIPPAKDGKSVEPAEIEAMIEAAVAKIPPPQDGKSADMDEVRKIIAELVDQIPRPEDGKSPNPEDLAAMVAAQLDVAISQLPPAQPGRDADPEEIRMIVLAELDAVVKSLPKPADGHTPTVEELAPLIETALSRAVAALPKPKDGVGLFRPLIDRSGSLIFTLTDGSVCDLGRVVGEDADPAEILKTVESLIDQRTASAEPRAFPEIIPDDLAEMVAKGIAALAESPAAGRLAWAGSD